MNGAPSSATSDDDQIIRQVYADGLRTKYWVDLYPVDTDGTPDSEDQVTTYTYGTSKGTSAGDSKAATGNLLQKVQYPDSSCSHNVAVRSGPTRSLCPTEHKPRPPGTPCSPLVAVVDLVRRNPTSTSDSNRSRTVACACIRAVGSATHLLVCHDHRVRSAFALGFGLLIPVLSGVLPVAHGRHGVVLRQSAGLPRQEPTPHAARPWVVAKVDGLAADDVVIVSPSYIERGSWHIEPTGFFNFVNYSVTHEPTLLDGESPAHLGSFDYLFLLQSGWPFRWIELSSAGFDPWDLNRFRARVDTRIEWARLLAGITLTSLMFGTVAFLPSGVQAYIWSRSGRCYGCGHDLRASAGPFCPECGRSKRGHTRPTSAGQPSHQQLGGRTAQQPSADRSS